MADPHKKADDNEGGPNDTPEAAEQVEDEWDQTDIPTLIADDFSK